MLHAPARPSVLTREGILWRQLDSATVAIEIDVENPFDEPLPPDTLVIEAAPFGAFLPRSPLASVAVDAIEPGERRRIVTEVVVLDLPESPRWEGAESETWIGNLHILFSGRPDEAVERHRAFDTVIPTGQTVAFDVAIVRGGRCRVRCEPLAPGWSARLDSLRAVRTARGEAVEEAAVLVVEHMVIVSVRAPSAPGRSDLVMWVTREKDGKSVPIEFELIAA